ncbi:MAG: alpha-L-fucosidase, partial [Bacteroidales bacterium]|nr:alpha-L-fucosidase [Bacteroidales bacterium]
MRKVLLAAGIIFLIFSCTPKQQTAEDQEAGTNSALSEQDKRMEWWRDARFGLFIHWGLYAQ